MTHLTRYGRRLKMTLIAGMSAACFACIFAIPFAENKFNNKVGYYSIVFNGEEIGSANSRQEAEQAMAAARLKFSKEYDSVVYMDNNIDIVEEHKLVASRMSQDELETAIYSSLFNCVTDKENATAYTVRINDFTVTLASKDDVVELMEKVTDKYDTKKEFQVKLSSGDGSYGAYSVDVVQSELKNTDTDIVAAALNGQMVSVATDSDTAKDGITGISFEQNVVVNETLAAGANIVSVQQAYDEITKEKEEKTMYVVEEGDCLSLIAGKCDIALNDLLALNEGLTEESLIIPGDELVVTVPKSEISVVVTQRMTYEEDYNAPVQYVDDDTAYRGTNTVISEGTTGHHKVTADVTFVNGVKTDVSYVNEEVMVESQPQVVSVGTLTPPTYLRPISGGSVSSEFGYRWGTLHSGVDWYVSVGTPVRAAAAGTVIRAGWYSTYGYCVDIRHSDGSMTRYAHLNSVTVSNGQYVNQSDLIAYSGNTGYSTGPHLHFEIWIGGTPVNPLYYVNKN